MEHKYKYSKLAKLICPKLSWEELVEYQEKHDFCTGKTTAEILALLGHVMKNPNSNTPMCYHVEYNYVPSRAAGGILDTIKHLITKLGLKFIEIDENHMTMTYKPYGYVTKGWVEVEDESGDNTKPKVV